MTKDSLLPMDEICERETLAPIPQGWHALRHAILADGSLAVLVSDVDIVSERKRVVGTKGHLSHPSRIEAMIKAGNGRILILMDGMWNEALSFPLETPFPLFDRFADGRWLVAASRTDRKPNARIFAPEGDVMKRIMLGDGIEHIKIDDANLIWVGWFDEGVFGNSEWKVPGLEWPPSSKGIGCFSADGAILPMPEWPSGVDEIADCYSLNVVGQDAWVCAYIDFPIVCLSKGKARWWESALSGPSAIAVSSGYVVAAGGYGEDANQVILLELDRQGLSGSGGKAISRAEGRLPLRRTPSEKKADWTPVWSHPDLLEGRGSVLHLIDDGIWYRWRVWDVVQRLGSVLYDRETQPSA